VRYLDLVRDKKEGVCLDFIIHSSLLPLSVCSVFGNTSVLVKVRAGHQGGVRGELGIHVHHT
jgi:hypothetical protein